MRARAVLVASAVAFVASVLALAAPRAALHAQESTEASRPVAQGMPRITVTSATLSADTIEIGDRFQLSLVAVLAPHSVAFLPDSIMGPGFEPFGPVEWTSRALPDGAIEVSVTYPLIAFQVGTVTVPEFEVFAADATEGRSTGLASGDATVGDFEGFIENVTMLPSARLRSVPPLDVWVASVLILEDQEYGIAPRPAADVAGRDRNWPATALGLLFGFGLLSVSVVTLRDWSASRSRSHEPVPPTPRDAALAALDRLVAEGAHITGDTRGFFSASSEIVRRYVETFDGRWGPSWTSTELMHGLSGRTRPDPSLLTREMALAEAVKFGGIRPDADAAERHVRALRDWIAGASSQGAAA